VQRRDTSSINFEHFNVIEISVYSDGQQQQPLPTDFTNSRVRETERYNAVKLFTGTGKAFRDEGN